jgi:hypothetical protein
MTGWRNYFEEEMNMSSEISLSEISRSQINAGKINPEAAEPSTIQSNELSDRNPPVGEWGEGGGLIATPAAAEGRVTPEGAAVPADAGLTNYDTWDGQ